MYPDWVDLVALGLLTLWLGILSFVIWQQGNFLKLLFPRSGEGDIRKKLDEIARIVDKNNKHIQRVYLSRYNPYDETGGDQSFSVALLDNEGTGIVVTSLHARSGTRVFAKPVIKGKSSKYQLSEEEELVIKKALE